MSGNTARDVLIAEMLGDIGKLHDLVARLNSELPSMVAQVESMLVANKASTMAPQKAAQQFLDGYFKHELKSIFDTASKAKDAALLTLHSEILAIVNTELVGARVRSERIADAAALRFERAVDAGSSSFEKAVQDSAKVAQRNASDAINKICQELSDKVAELQTERRKNQWLAMIGACASTGLLVGALSVFVMR